MGLPRRPGPADATGGAPAPSIFASHGRPGSSLPSDPRAARPQARPRDPGRAEPHGRRHHPVGDVGARGLRAGPLDVQPVDLPRRARRARRPDRRGRAPAPARLARGADRAGRPPGPAHVGLHVGRDAVGDGRRAVRGVLHRQGERGGLRAGHGAHAVHDAHGPAVVRDAHRGPLRLGDLDPRVPDGPGRGRHRDRGHLPRRDAHLHRVLRLRHARPPPDPGAVRQLGRRVQVAPAVRADGPAGDPEAPPPGGRPPWAAGVVLPQGRRLHAALLARPLRHRVPRGAQLLARLPARPVHDADGRPLARRPRHADARGLGRDRGAVRPLPLPAPAARLRRPGAPRVAGRGVLRRPRAGPVRGRRRRPRPARGRDAARAAGARPRRGGGRAAPAHLATA